MRHRFGPEAFIGLLLSILVPALHGCADPQGPVEEAATELAAAASYAFSSPELQALADHVEALKTAGSLTNGQANSLLAQLQQIEHLSLRDGHAENVAAALLQHLASLVDEGVLTPAEAEPLINGVRNIATPSIAATAVTLGHFFACALTEDGAAFCWGTNDRGQLGNGSFENSNSPVPVAGGHVFQSIDAEGDYICGLNEDGVALCWGGNQNGMLGDGTTDDRAVPAPVAGDLRFAHLSVGVAHACGLTTDDELFCWGGGGPQAPDGTSLGRDLGLGILLTEECPGLFAGPWPCVTTPQRVDNGLEFEQVTAGLYSTCGLTSDGTAHCWGWNFLWQLGNGTETSSLSPVAVAGGRVFDALDAGAVHVCGTDASGAGYCWGSRAFYNGELGTGSFAGEPVPAPIAGGHSFDRLRPSGSNNIFGHTCGVTRAGDAYCWGPNNHGQLGTLEATTTCPSPNLGETCTSVPLEVFGSIPFAEIDAGGVTSTCGVGTSGNVYCWGGNDTGQLGNGTNDPAATPAKVILET